MSVEVVSKSIEMPKEASEIVEALVGVLEDALEGKGVAVIAAENLPAFMAAVEGWQKVGEEVKHESVSGAAGYLVQRAMAAFLKKKSAQ